MTLPTIVLPVTFPLDETLCNLLTHARAHRHSAPTRRTRAHTRARTRSGDGPRDQLRTSLHQLEAEERQTTRGEARTSPAPPPRTRPQSLSRHLLAPPETSVGVEPGHGDSVSLIIRSFPVSSILGKACVNGLPAVSEQHGTEDQLRPFNQAGERSYIRVVSAAHTGIARLSLHCRRDCPCSRERGVSGY
jgi:hypothetical protein